jgi:hypothetical protein
MPRSARIPTFGVTATRSRLASGNLDEGVPRAHRSHLFCYAVGIDIDPELIAAAEEDHPGPQWIVGDLADLDLRSVGVEPGFDVIVSAGNVMTFVAAASRQAVLTNLASMMADNGRLVVGFGAGRGYAFDHFDADAMSAGLRFDLRLATWDLQPWAPESDFLVAVLRRDD